jgi:lysophospholipase L1-like esterase
VHRVWSAGLVLVAVVVFVLAGYVLVHDNGVHRAGRIPRQPAADTVSAPAPSSAGSSAPSRPPPVVAFVGDDWTSGVGASSPAKRFTSLVSAALNLDEKNFGVAGSGYAKQGNSGGGDYASRVAAVVAAQPALVVVSGGRNDVTDNLGFAASRARRLFEQLRKRLPGAIVVVVSPFWGDSPATAPLKQVARVVRLAAKGAGASYLDVPDPILGHAKFMADAGHPNNRGYAAIAAALEKRLPKFVPR